MENNFNMATTPGDNFTASPINNSNPVTDSNPAPANSPASVNIPTSAAPIPSSTSRLPLIVIIILSAVVLLQSIALIILLNNRPATSGVDDSAEIAEDSGNIEEIDYTTSSSYTYDESNNLTAFNIACASNVGASFKFNGDGNYTQQDAMNNIISSGNYQIHDSHLVHLTPSNGAAKTLYYLDGTKIADGLDIYTCTETAEENAE